MELVKRKLVDLKPAEYNPRKALTPDDPEYQHIAASIEQFGYVDPIIINRDDTIIGGHQRRTVMMDLGHQEADVIVVDIDKNNEKALNIALNKITGEWDETALKSLLIDLDQADFEVSLTGFEDDEILKLFENVELGQEANEDDYDPEKKLAEITETRTRPGDIWQLGNHRLMCGDATDYMDIGLLMAGASADLIITDPPYNIDYESKVEALEKVRTRNTTRTENQIKNDKMDNNAFYRFLYKAFSNLYETAKPGCVIYIFHADIEGLNFRTAMRYSGFKPAQTLIWEKSKFSLCHQDYQWRHEPVLYGWKEGAAHFFVSDRSQDTIFMEDDIDYKAMKKPELVAYIEGIRAELSSRTSVLYEKKPNKSDLHPTMKPVSLVGRFITNSSRYNENILDVFGGSGTTLIAAEQLDRNAYLMELNEKYCNIIIDRWEQYTGREAVKVREG